MNALIELNDIIKDYGHLRALDGISLAVGRGVTGLLGPNGAGKTTLIKVLLGLVRITHGSGQVLGLDLTQSPRQIRAQVGYMPEDDCYIAGLSGVEMMQFAARLSGQESIEGMRRSHEILDFSGVEQERYRKVETYSTGMRQKLKFAQALVHDPPILILDEPTAGLDPEERQAMLSRIGVLARDVRKAVLLSTHILPDVQAVCDNVAIIARGQMRVTESLEVLSRPASPTYHLRVLGKSELLVARLEQAGAEVALEEDGTLTITGGQEDLPQRVWTWAEALGVGIRQLTDRRNSLEQIFVDAVQGDVNAAS